MKGRKPKKKEIKRFIKLLIDDYNYLNDDKKKSDDYKKE